MEIRRLLLQLWWPVGLPAPPQSPGSNEASLEICPPINFRKETAAIPLGSMYGIYANIGGILMVKYGKCYHIYHTWILWVCDELSSEVDMGLEIASFEKDVMIFQG